MAKKEEKQASEDLSGGPIALMEAAPLPTKATLRARQGLVRQFFKFIAFDLTIMRMVLKGHNPKR